MFVEQRAGEHVGAGDGELERAGGQEAGTCWKSLARLRRAFADLAFDDAGRAGAEAEVGEFVEFFFLGAADLRADVLKGADEVIDHAVGFGMIDVVAIEFAVGEEVEAGHLLGFDDDGHGVAEGFFGGVGGEPGGDGIAADDGGEDVACHGDLLPRRCRTISAAGGRRTNEMQAQRAEATGCVLIHTLPPTEGLFHVAFVVAFFMVARLSKSFLPLASRGAPWRSRA